MNRRNFFGVAAAASAIASTPAVAASLNNSGLRISAVEGDPGERLYADCCGDGRSIRVYVDGVEEKFVVTADEAQGYVDRTAFTPMGNLSVSHADNRVLTERIYGDVKIVIGEPDLSCSRMHYDGAGSSWASLPREVGA